MNKYTVKQLRQYIGKDLGAMVVVDSVESVEYRTALLVLECKRCGHRKKMLPSKTINKAMNKCDSCGFVYKSNSYTLSISSKSRERIRNTYNNMMRKCYDKNYKAYHKYGGSNIRVDKKNWGSAAQFIDWSLKNNYTPSSRLYRVDESLDFSPENCYWSNSEVKGDSVRKVIVNLERIARVIEGDIRLLEKINDKSNLKDRLAWLHREIAEMLGEDNG